MVGQSVAMKSETNGGARKPRQPSKYAGQNGLPHDAERIDSLNCTMAAIPTIEHEDPRRPSRERESLVNECTRIVNRLRCLSRARPEATDAETSQISLYSPAESAHARDCGAGSQPSYYAVATSDHERGANGSAASSSFLTELLAYRPIEFCRSASIRLTAQPAQKGALKYSGIKAICFRPPVFARDRNT